MCIFQSLLGGVVVPISCSCRCYEYRALAPEGCRVRNHAAGKEGFVIARKADLKAGFKTASKRARIAAMNKAVNLKAIRNERMLLLVRRSTSLLLIFMRIL